MKKLIFLCLIILSSSLFAQERHANYAGRFTKFNLLKTGKAAADTTFSVSSTSKQDSTAVYSNPYPFGSIGYLISNVDTAKVNITFQGASTEGGGSSAVTRFQTLITESVTATSTSWRYFDVSFAKQDTIPPTFNFRVFMEWQAAGDSSSATNVKLIYTGINPNTL